MLQVKSIKIYAGEPSGFPVAIMSDDSGWYDPHGGVFEDGDKYNFDKVLSGKLQSVHVGSRWYDNLIVVVERVST